MSLRKVRSLTTLRVLESAFKQDLQAAKPLPGRQVHNTSKKGHTTLLNTDTGFSLMSLKSLKHECRQRGLKVSGKKIELIGRLSAHEAAYSTKTFAQNNETTKNVKTAAKAAAAAFSTTVDRSQTVEYSTKAEDKSIGQIPSLCTKAAETPVTEVEKKIQDAVEEATKANQQSVSAEASSGNVFHPGIVEGLQEAVESLHQQETSKGNTASSKQESSETKSESQDRSKNDSKSDSKNDSADPELTARDRKFLLGFGTAVAAWWSTKFM